MNYSKTSDPTHEDKPEDWLVSAMIFSRAIRFLLKENEAVVVQLDDETKALMEQAEGLENLNKVLVIKRGDRTFITKCTVDNVDEGTKLVLRS